MRCEILDPQICQFVVSASRIPQFYWDICWYRGVAESPYFEGATQRGTEKHRWNGAVVGIEESYGLGHSGTEQQGESQSGTDQYVAGQVLWSSIISKQSTAENSSTDLGVASTGVTDQHGVVCSDGGGVQRRDEVDLIN